MEHYPCNEILDDCHWKIERVIDSRLSNFYKSRKGDKPMFSMNEDGEVEMKLNKTSVPFVRNKQVGSISIPTITHDCTVFDKDGNFIAEVAELHLSDKIQILRFLEGHNIG